MAKYCDAQQHQLSQLSHLWDGAQELYSKVQDEGKVLALEREVAELRQKLAEVTRAHDVLGHQIKKVSQLEAEVANLKHANKVPHLEEEVANLKYANSVQLSIHQLDMESHRAEIQRL